MPEPRRLKKSETLEIRIPYPTKQAFMARCRDEGVSASEVLRAYIDGRLDDRARSRRRRVALRLAVGGLIAAAVGAVALPSLARPSVLSEFERLDRDGDRRVSFAEFWRGASVAATVEVGHASLPVAAGAARGPLVRQAFERLDLDGDGVVTLAEFRRRGAVNGSAAPGVSGRD